MKNTNLLYPLTIISDRYSGTYSGGNYLAFNEYFYDIPEEIDADDVTCSVFWSEHGDEHIVGKGDKIDDAINDLFTKIK